jgi:hypothetical protein
VYYHHAVWRKTLTSWKCWAVVSTCVYKLFFDLCIITVDTRRQLVRSGVTLCVGEQGECLTVQMTGFSLPWCWCHSRCSGCGDARVSGVYLRVFR